MEAEHASQRMEARKREDAASASRFHVAGGVHGARGGMGRWARSASLHFSGGPIPELAQTIPRLVGRIAELAGTTS